MKDDETPNFPPPFDRIFGMQKRTKQGTPTGASTPRQNSEPVKPEPVSRKQLENLLKPDPCGSTNGLPSEPLDVWEFLEAGEEMRTRRITTFINFLAGESLSSVHITAIYNNAITLSLKSVTEGEPRFVRFHMDATSLKKGQGLDLCVAMRGAEQRHRCHMRIRRSFEAFLGFDPDYVAIAKSRIDVAREKMRKLDGDHASGDHTSGEDS